MNSPISDSVIDRIARRVLAFFAERLAASAPPPIPERAPPPPAPSIPQPRTPKLAYSVAELSKELGVCPLTIFRLEKRGLLKSCGATRRKLYSHTAVQTFLAKTEVGGAFE